MLPRSPSASFGRGVGLPDICMTMRASPISYKISGFSNPIVVLLALSDLASIAQMHAVTALIHPAEHLDESEFCLLARCASMETRGMQSTGTETGAMIRSELPADAAWFSPWEWSVGCKLLLPFQKAFFGGIQALRAAWSCS